MAKNQVTVGGKYYAMVTKKRVEVQIESEHADGGWNAINLSTGKKVHIQNAERLLGEVKATKVKAKAVVEASVEPATAVPKRVDKSKSQDAATEKPLSCIAAALKILGECNEPLNTQQMIATMAEKGYWTSPGGKTPHATLYSAILREIITRGDESRFVKAERGLFKIASGKN